MIEYINLNDLDEITISDALISKIKEIRNKYNFNRIIVSTIIFNIISDSFSFNYDTISDDDIGGMIDYVPHVGKISDLDVYLNLDMKRNQILFSFDIESIRDSKISSILENKISSLEEVILEVKSRFI